MGIYGIFWYYFINREMRDYGRAKGTDECGESPVSSLLAFTIGAFIIVPWFLTLFRSFKRVNAANRISGAGAEFDAGLGLLLWLFISPIAIYIMQMNLNKVWEKDSASIEAGTAAASLPEVQAATAPAPQAPPADQA